MMAAIIIVAIMVGTAIATVSETGKEIESAIGTGIGGIGIGIGVGNEIGTVIVIAMKVVDTTTVGLGYVSAGWRAGRRILRAMVRSGRAARGRSGGTVIARGKRNGAGTVSASRGQAGTTGAHEVLNTEGGMRDNVPVVVLFSFETGVVHAYYEASSPIST